MTPGPPVDAKGSESCFRLNEESCAPRVVASSSSMFVVGPSVPPVRTIAGLSPKRRDVSWERRRGVPPVEESDHPPDSRSSPCRRTRTSQVMSTARLQMMRETADWEMGQYEEQISRLWEG